MTVAAVGLFILATLPFSGPALVGAGVAAATVATAANATVAVGLTIAGESLLYAAASKSKDDVDPYRRSGQKKQGRELKNKSRQSENFRSRNNRRDNLPAPPKHHTPGKAHQKDFFFFIDEENDDYTYDPGR